MSFHFLITKLMIGLGSRNLFIRYLIGRRCRTHGATVAYRDGVIELRKKSRAMLLAERHFIYAPDMAMRFDSYFSPIVPHFRGGLATVDYSKPGLQTYRKSGLQFELASFPEEDEAIEGYFRWYRPQPGDTIFDVGAHCGVSTYHFSKLVGNTGNVVAFEPDPLNFSLLLRNIARHKLQNVTPLQIALAGSPGRATFHCEGTIGSGLARNSSRATVGTVEIVETITLAEAFRQWGTPSLCKIDIEGSEIEVVAAAKDLLIQCKGNFALDTNHMVDGCFTNSRIEKLFKGSGYEAESAEVAGMMTTWARPKTAKIAEGGELNI